MKPALPSVLSGISFIKFSTFLFYGRRHLRFKDLTMNPKKQWLGVYSSQSDAAGGAAEAAAAGQVVPREDQGSRDHQSSSLLAVGAAGGNSNSNKVRSHPVERGSVAASSAGVVTSFLFCDLKTSKTRFYKLPAAR